MVYPLALAPKNVTFIGSLVCGLNPAITISVDASSFQFVAAVFNIFFRSARFLYPNSNPVGVVAYPPMSSAYTRPNSTHLSS